jgi:hypothetical protein
MKSSEAAIGCRQPDQHAECACVAQGDELILPPVRLNDGDQRLPDKSIYPVSTYQTIDG